MTGVQTCALPILARMFGVHLPINFYSPYKANSIIEFWRRWHITLARFLRDYLYIPLAGNRKGNTRRYIALIITMFLDGLWHGAGWTFIIWGGMHGIFLSINHAWNSMVRKVFPRNNDESSIITKIACRLVTFVAVVIAWVMFRADSVESAMAIYSGMFGCNGISLPVLLESRLGEFGETLKMFGINYAGMFQNLFFGDGKIGIIQLFVMLIIIS